LHTTRGSPLGLYLANLEAIGFFVMKSGQLAHSQFRVLCAMRAILLEDESSG